MTGFSDRPCGVIEYSTRGGTSANTFRLMRPLRSNSLSLAVNMCCVTPGIERLSSLNLTVRADN